MRRHSLRWLEDTRRYVCRTGLETQTGRAGLLQVSSLLTRSGLALDSPMLVDKVQKGEIVLDHFITHRFSGVAGTNQALEALHSGDCLRAVVTY